MQLIFLQSQPGSGSIAMPCGAWKRGIQRGRRSLPSPPPGHSPRNMGRGPLLPHITCAIRDAHDRTMCTRISLVLRMPCLHSSMARRHRVPVPWPLSSSSPRGLLHRLQHAYDEPVLGVFVRVLLSFLSFIFFYFYPFLPIFTPSFCRRCTIYTGTVLCTEYSKSTGTTLVR